MLFIFILKEINASWEDKLLLYVEEQFVNLLLKGETIWMNGENLGFKDVVAPHLHS